MMENVEEILPLSPVQSGMLFEAISGQAAPGTYVAAVTISLEGTLDLERFQTALNNAIRVRDALRASFIWEGVSQPVQLIAKTIALPITMLDWSDNKSPDTALKNLIEIERKKGLDLKQAPLMRATLIKLNGTEHRFIWTAHHLIADGWSHQTRSRILVRLSGRYRGAHFHRVQARSKTSSKRAFPTDHNRSAKRSNQSRSDQRARSPDHNRHAAFHSLGTHFAPI